MPEVWVCNASPLIALGQIRRLDLLDDLPRPILVRVAVLTEIEPGNSEHRAADTVWGSAHFKVVSTVDLAEIVRRWELDPGESQVLSVAVQQPGAGVLLDDLAARRCAGFLRLPMIGTVGLVARAKKKGRIAAAAPILHAQIEAGLFITPTLRMAVLEDLGEALQ